MGLFTINYKKLIWQNMPVRLRQDIHYAWLKCLAAPVIYLYGLFTTNRASNLYRLRHNSQVCYMEAVLNDLFDNSGRRLFITDVNYHDPLYIYIVPEVKPLFLDLVSEIGSGVIPGTDPVPLYTGAETGFTAPFFIVHVPVSIAFDEARMRAVIDQYRLAGRTFYQIVTY